MGVEFTQQAEARRIKEREAKWEYLETTSLVKAVRTARDMGWADKQVQVRYVTIEDVTTYFVEPYEKNCGCRGILKYEDYYA